MATANKTSNTTGKTTIIGEIYAWISGIITRKRSNNEQTEEKATSYYQCEEYERQRIRNHAQKQINRAKYQARGNW